MMFQSDNILLWQPVFSRNNRKGGATNSKQDTIMRSAISAHDKLCATMKFLGSGASKKISCTHSVSPQPPYQSLFLGVSDHLWCRTYMKISSSSLTAQWQLLAAEFEIEWPLFTASSSVK